MSFRRWCGWSPRQTQIGDSTWTEPEYDSWERALQTAYDQWEAGLCRSCGVHHSVSVYAPVKPRFLVELVQCAACQTLEDVQAKHRERFPVEDGKGVSHEHWRVYPDPADEPTVEELIGDGV